MRDEHLLGVFVAALLGTVAMALGLVVTYLVIQLIIFIVDNLMGLLLILVGAFLYGIFGEYLNGD